MHAETATPAFEDRPAKLWTLPEALAELDRAAVALRARGGGQSPGLAECWRMLWEDAVRALWRDGGQTNRWVALCRLPGAEAGRETTPAGVTVEWFREFPDTILLTGSARLGATVTKPSELAEETERLR